MTEEMLSAGNVAVKGFLANSELSAIYLAMRALDPQVAALEAALEPFADLQKMAAMTPDEVRAASNNARAALATIQKG